MRSLSTHVLDAVTGEPAVGLGVRLARRGGVGDGDRVGDGDGDSGAGWIELAAARTDADGRVGNLAPQGLDPGVHRLVFDTAAYFTATEQTGFYPEVSIAFTVTGERHYHVPLLLSPYAFSTYRGS